MRWVSAVSSCPLASYGARIYAPAVPIRETRRSSLGEPGRPPRSLRAHHKILEAIRRGDAPGARQAMRRHVNMVADVGLLRWSAAQRDGEGAGLAAPAR